MATGNANAANLSSVLECPVCMEKFTDPRILPCGHTFCRQCLERLVVQHEIIMNKFFQLIASLGYSTDHMSDLS